MERKTNKEVLIVIVSVLIIVLVAYLSIYPSIQSLRNTNHNLSLKQQDLDNSESHLSNIKSLETKFNSQKKQLKALQETMPNRDDVESLLVMMESAASKNGLVVSGFTPTTFDEDDEYGEFDEASITTSSGLGIDQATYEMGLIGSYGSLKNFLAQVENSRRVVNVTGLTVSSSISAIASGSLNITLEFTTYYLKQS